MKKTNMAAASYQRLVFSPKYGQTDKNDYDSCEKYDVNYS